MQVVKYKWETNQIHGEPFLFVREGGAIIKLKLFGEKMNMKVGKKHCIGYTKGGRHSDCPNMRLVDNERVCRECALNDDFFFCMKCTGEECINEPQRPACIENKYYIYLAAFSSILKVGISQEYRILERLIEQGADMGAKIGLVRDGKLARELEQRIRNDLNIQDRVSGLEKQKMLFGNINVAAVNIFNAFTKLRSNGYSEYLIGPEIYNLQSVYRLSSVSHMPSYKTLTENCIINGNVVAAKGNIIVAENESSLFSIDANKLIGCDVELIG